MVMLFVLFVPILTVPRVAPLPAFMTTFPPVPPVPDSVPPAIVTVPPVPPVPDSVPPVTLRASPFPAAALFTPGCRDKEVAPMVVISEESPPTRESAPVEDRIILL
jgi:hypothetical protein